MSGQVNRSPVGFSVIGNMAPEEVSAPSTVAVFTANNCTLTLESAVNIDGHLLVPVKSVTNW